MQIIGTDFVIKGEKLKFDASGYGLGYELFNCMKRNEKEVAQFIVESDVIDTYGDLLKRCLRTSLTLIKKGITCNDIIGLCTENHINSCVPFIASQFIGATVSSLDPSLSFSEICYLIEKIKPKIIFVSDQALENVLKSVEYHNLDTIVISFGLHDSLINFSDFLLHNEKEEHFEPTKIQNIDQTAIIFFSSGTTGLPKGICISHRSRIIQTLNSIRYWNAGEECLLSNYKYSTKVKEKVVFLNFASLYWVSAVSILTRSIFGGSARVICSQFNKHIFWDIVGKYQVTYLFLTPNNLKDLGTVRMKEIDNVARTVITGSCPVSTKNMDDLKKYFPKANIIHAYGQTEAGGIITSFHINRKEDMLLQIKKPLSCGKIIEGISIKVIDIETGQTLGPNLHGEILYKTSFAMNGYYNMDSSQAFDTCGWIKSGDIGYYDEELCFYIVDRIKEMLKYKGWHIAPAFLENILNLHPRVQESVVIGIPHEEDGDYPLAVVVLKEDKNEYINETDIEKFVEDRVSERQKLRGGVKIVKEIPKTATGKIKRLSIKQMILNNQL